MLLHLLVSDADHQLLYFGNWEHLLKVQKNQITVAIRRGFEAVNANLVLQKPKDCRGDLLPKLSSHHYEALIIACVQADLGEVFLLQK